MRLTSILIFVGCLQASAGIFGQNVTFSGNKISVETVFKSIKQQTGFLVVYNSDILLAARPVTISVTNMPLSDFLRQALKGQPFDFQIEGKTIVLSFVNPPPNRSPERDRISLLAVFPVSGVVRDAEGVPVPKVSVVVKGSKNSTSTDDNGIFSLNVNVGDVLIFSSVGFSAQEFTINSNTTSVVISLKRAVTNMDEAIVVAYGTTTRRMNTGSVSVVKGEQIATLPNRSFDKSLQGLVPGLQITQGTGQPGGGVANMVLRGISTGTEPQNASTVRNPLIVIDGIPVSQDEIFPGSGTYRTSITNPLAQLNPSDIETITVLKDAAAIALYGSKASNGVILVTTKTGKSGKTIYSFRHQTDIAKRMDGDVKFLKREEYLELLYESYRNTYGYLDSRITSELFTRFPYIKTSPTDSSFYPEADWFGAIYNDHALTTTNELSMSGGNDKSSFYLNAGWTKQDGVVKATGYDRKSLRINFENRPAKGLKMGVNTTLSYNTQDYSNTGEGDATSYAFAPLTSPLVPIYDSSGNYILKYSTLFNTPNSVAEAEYNVKRLVSFRGLTKFYAELRLFNHFSLSSSLGVDYMSSERKEKHDPRFVDVIATGIAGRIYENTIRNANLINTNALRFNRSIKKDHAINILLAEESQILTTKSIASESRGDKNEPPLSYYNQLNSPGYIVYSTNAVESKQTLLSLFGQANYGFRDKYFFSASVRGDASSRFGPRSQWGTFWSAGLGWVVSEESFIKMTASWLSYLKLRGSVGSAGSSAAVAVTTRYNILERISGNVTGFYDVSPPGNPDIEWEQTFNWDAGLEAKFLKDRISLTADIYNRKTTNLIYTTNLPLYSGYATVLDNIGDMKNWGIELSILGRLVNLKNFRWSISANWSTNKNILVKSDVNLKALTGATLANEVGRNFNSFYMIRWAGVNPADGSALWIDSTGKPTTNPSAGKKEFVGKPQPDGFGAITNNFSFKNIELSVQLYYQYGFEIFKGFSQIGLNDGGTSSSFLTNQSKYAMDRWQTPGDITANPKRIIGTTVAGVISTRYLSKGDYLRLQNISLSYSFSKQILNRLQLSSLKLFAQGYNLAIWTLFPGRDPDNTNVGGISTAPYPLQRSYSFGLNVDF